MKVIGVDRARRNVSLSIRALQRDPLTETIESLEWRPTEEARACVFLAGAGRAGAARGGRMQPHMRSTGRPATNSPPPTTPTPPTPTPQHPRAGSEPYARARTPAKPRPQQVPSDIMRIVAVLQSTAGINSVAPGRQAETHTAVAQDLELYLTKDDLPGGGFVLAARSGRVLQELLIDTGLGRDDMKKALTRVLSRVR